MTADPRADEPDRQEPTREPLRLDFSHVALNEIGRAPGKGLLETLACGGNVALEQMPFADIEIRLALLSIVSGGRIQRLDRHSAEIKRGDRVGPDLGLELPYAAFQRQGGLGIVVACFEHVDPDRQIGRRYPEIPPVASPGLRPIPGVAPRPR